MVSIRYPCVGMEETWETFGGEVLPLADTASVGVMYVAHVNMFFVHPLLPVPVFEGCN